MSQAQPMDEYERAHHYTGQWPGRPLTPRQIRRMNKKSKKVLVATYQKEPLG